MRIQKLGADFYCYRVSKCQLRQERQMLREVERFSFFFQFSLIIPEINLKAVTSFFSTRNFCPNAMIFLRALKIILHYKSLIVQKHLKNTSTQCRYIRMSDTEVDVHLDNISLGTVAEVLKVIPVVLKKKYFLYFYSVSLINHIITFPVWINVFCNRTSESHFKNARII